MTNTQLIIVHHVLITLLITSYFSNLSLHRQIKMCSCTIRQYIDRSYEIVNAYILSLVIAHKRNQLTLTFPIHHSYLSQIESYFQNQFVQSQESRQSSAHYNKSERQIKKVVTRNETFYTVFAQTSYLSTLQMQQIPLGLIEGNVYK